MLISRDVDKDSSFSSKLIFGVEYKNDISDMVILSTIKSDIFLIKRKEHTSPTRGGTRSLFIAFCLLPSSRRFV